jgi:hypothetical protein
MADAKETLAAYLRPYNLEAQDVIDAAWAFVQANPGLADNSDLIIASTRNTTTYKNRFKGNEQRVAKGLTELSPAAYLQYEESLRQAIRRSGFPVGFYDTQQDFERFIGADVDGPELTTRLERGYKAVSQADPQIVAEMKRLYMVDDASLAAYFLDPARAEEIVLRQANAAQVAAQATTQAQMTLSAQEAESLARQGVGTEEAMRGFGAIQQSRELFDVTLGGEEEITRQQQIEGALGTNAAAAQRIATRRRRRQAEFEAGGGLAETQQGITGLRTVGQ